LAAEKVAGPDAVTGCCRRCTSALPNTRTPFARAGSPGFRALRTWTGRVCPACGWRNLDPVPVALDADLGEGLSYLSEIVAPAQNAGGGEAVEAVTALRDALVARLRAEVAAAPAEAFTWLMDGLNSLPELDAETGADDFFLLGLQQLYLAAVERGPLIASHPPVAGFSPFWREPVAYLLHMCTTVSMALREAGVGAPISIEDGMLRVGISREATWAAEVNMNSTADPGTDLYTLQDSAAVRRIEREAFQDSAMDLLDLFTGERNILRRTRVATMGDVLVIDVGPWVDPVLRRMIAAGTLDLERVRLHAAPSWGFVAGAPIERSVPAALAAATEADWFNYAPMLAAGQKAGSHIVPAAITSGYLLHRASVKAAVTVSFRLHTAVQAAQRHGPILAKRVGTLVLDFHRHFERSVANRIEEAGFTTCQGFDTVHGRPISCGEIDVIGHADHSAGPPVVVVAEVKNNDLTFAKDLALQQAWALMARARRQALVKAGWVATHWAEVAPLLGAAADSSPTVLALVVTRRYALPTGEAGVAFLAAHEVGPILTTLRTEPLPAWRADLRKAVAVPGPT
jgi:hypothetical protein